MGQTLTPSWQGVGASPRHADAGNKRTPAQGPRRKFESNRSSVLAVGLARTSRARARRDRALAKQERDVSRQGLRRDLLEGALLRRLVGAEADEPRAMPEAIAGDMVVTPSYAALALALVASAPGVANGAHLTPCNLFWVPNISLLWCREVSLSRCIWVPYLGDLKRYSSFWGQKDEEGKCYAQSTG